MRCLVLLLVACGGSAATPAQPAEPPPRAWLEHANGAAAEPFRDMDACKVRLAMLEEPERKHHEEQWMADLAAMRREHRELEEQVTACDTPYPTEPCRDVLYRHEMLEQRIRNFHAPQFEALHRCVER